MFNGCESFNRDISSWKTPELKTTTFMFWNCTAYTAPGGLATNGDIWDVSKVENMESMFSSCTNFNSDISSWNTSSCTNFQDMFLYATNFEQDISSWDISAAANQYISLEAYREEFPWDNTVKNILLYSKIQLNSATTTRNLNNKIYDSWIKQNNVTDVMLGSPYGARLVHSHTAISHPTNKNDLINNINDWLSKTSSEKETYNDPLKYWDVSQINDLSGLFQNKSFTGTGNDDISNWDVSQSTNMKSMFEGCIEFNGNISNWKPSDTALNNNSRMLHGCIAFNKNLNNTNWDNLTKANNEEMFRGTINYTFD